jgi:aspartate-semialdehyde dehydrogenase
VVSTYQAASGAGAEGMAELQQQARSWSAGKPLENSAFVYPLLFNLIPQIDTFQDNGYTREEMKVCWETRKIFGLPSLDVSCTAVRIPTLRAHAEALTIETWEPITPEAARREIDAADGVELVDDPAAKRYPMPLNASGKYDVEAGRIRQNLIFKNHGLDLFVCGDQLLRGAALNAVLIAEYYANKRFDAPPAFKPSLKARLAAVKLDLPAVAVVAAAAAALAVAGTLLARGSSNK